MKTDKNTLNVNDVKPNISLPYLLRLSIVLISCCLFFNGCAVLEEAHLTREARKKKRIENEYVLLTTYKGEAQVDENGKKAESEHYTLTLHDDMNSLEDFDDPLERKEFMLSVLSYMESLYDNLHERFGFEPGYKIHVIIYKNYLNNVRADTQKEYTISNQGKVLRRISVNFPLSMYQDPGVRAHELTHAFTAPYFLPMWFDEGIAVSIQSEFANSASHPKFDSLQTNLKRNLNGVNCLEDWETGGSPELTHWRYRYAYTIISELEKLHGKDFYIKTFQLMDADQLHNKLPNRMSNSFLLYYLSKAGGTDLVSFFLDLDFTVRKLSKAEILQHIND